MKQKRSSGIAIRRKRILPQKRPAAGGEARLRASVLYPEICLQEVRITVKVRTKLTEFT